MQEIVALISKEEHSEGDVQMFMRKIRRYAAITELDETVLNQLTHIDRRTEENRWEKDTGSKDCI